MKTVQVTLEVPDHVDVGKLVTHNAALAFAHDYMLWPHSISGRLYLTWVDTDTAQSIPAQVFPKPARQPENVIYL